MSRCRFEEARRRERQPKGRQRIEDVLHRQLFIFEDLVEVLSKDVG